MGFVDGLSLEGVGTGARTARKPVHESGSASGGTARRNWVLSSRMEVAGVAHEAPRVTAKGALAGFLPP